MNGTNQEITVRIIPHDEVLALRDENSRLRSALEVAELQRDDAMRKFASECNINMRLHDELRDAKKQLKRLEDVLCTK